MIAGFQASSSFRIDKQTVPLGYTFGWNRGGVNLPKVREISTPCQVAGPDVGLLLTLWGLCGILLWEDHDQFEKTTFPHGPFLAGDTALPLFDVEDARGISLGLREESEWVISAPELSTHKLVKRATCC